MSDAPKGHVKVARRTFDPIAGDPLWLEPREFSRWEAWIDVLQLASFRGRRHVTQHGIIDLERGEFVASLRWLAGRWTWTVKKVRTWLATLEKWARLRAQRETQAGTVYLIVNYERYQTTQSDTDTAQGTPEGTAGAQQGHKKEAVKQLSSTKTTVPPYDSIFEEAWAVYPKRPGNNKAEAWVQWLKRVGEGHDALDLLASARGYAKWCDGQDWKDGRRGILMARTFFGPNKRFEDDWSVEARPALVDEFGVLTAYGDRVTRPALSA